MNDTTQATLDGDESFQAIQQHLRTIKVLKEENKTLEDALHVARGGASPAGQSSPERASGQNLIL